MKTLSNLVITKLLLAPLMVVGMAVVLPAFPVSAADPDPVTCSTNGKVDINVGSKCAKSADQKGSLGNVLKDITNVLLFLIGAVSVIMIIIGGIRYVLSNGDSTQISGAKNTILYAVIGLIVALLAFAIVNFVVSSFMADPNAAEVVE